MNKVEWVSWEEASAIVGCPVPTIDWHTRTGRIKTRPHHGNRPTIDAASLEEFRVWWQDRERVREETRSRPRRRRKGRRPETPPSARPQTEGDWLSIGEACEILGLSESTVRHHIRRGDLAVTRQSRYVWLSAESVGEYASDREGRISEADAAKLVGCSKDVINRAVASGKIEQRQVANRAVPSLELASVNDFKAQWDERRRRRAEARAALEVKVGPPKDGEVWLGTSVTAALLGVSPSWVRELAREGRLPHHTSESGRRYFRRDHVERVAAARTAWKGGARQSKLRSRS